VTSVKSAARHVELRGIAWDHTRAMGPLSVTAQIFADLHDGCRVTWDRRSLWAFGEEPIDELASRYDLIVLDHPMIGEAVERGLLIPLDAHGSRKWIHEQRSQTVGASHASYAWENQVWAAAIDAACPVAAGRADLLAKEQWTFPETWEEVLALARETGRVALPLKPIDALSLFFSLCANQGYGLMETETGTLVDPDLGVHALAQIQEILSAINSDCLGLNPIDLLNKMSSSRDVIYSPHVFGYSNYGRVGYAPNRIAFGNFVGPGEVPHAGVTLGGAGLAVSAATAHVDEALRYATWVSGAECQSSTMCLQAVSPAVP